MIELWFGVLALTLIAYAVLDGVQRQIIGVLPASFTYGRSEQFWLPFNAAPKRLPPGDAGEIFAYSVVARLREDVSIDATRAGLEWVVAVAHEDELRLALDRLDPEILLLSAREAREDEALEHVLGLLPDVPAGKLAIAELAVRTREEIVELERAGVDAVVVRAEDVARLVGDLQPQP